MTMRRKRRNDRRMRRAPKRRRPPVQQVYAAPPPPAPPPPAPRIRTRTAATARSSRSRSPSSKRRSPTRPPTFSISPNQWRHQCGDARAGAAAQRRRNSAPSTAIPDVGFDDAPEAPEAREPEPAPFPPAPARAYDEHGRLISGATSVAVNSAFNALAQTVLSQNARTLEDLVREMLRPMLKSWLDDNLPGMVERMVRAEIERVSRGRPG